MCYKLLLYEVCQTEEWKMDLDLWLVIKDWPSKQNVIEIIMMWAWLEKCLCSEVHWNAEYEVSVKYKGADHWPTGVCSDRHAASLRWGVCEQPGCLQHTGVKIKNYQKKRRSKFLRSQARRRTDLSSLPECGSQQRSVNVCPDTLWERHNMKCCAPQALGGGTSLTSLSGDKSHCTAAPSMIETIGKSLFYEVMNHTEEMTKRADGLCLSCVTCSLSLSSPQAKF